MIQLTYGNSQQFRFRHRDINLLGSTDARLPLKRSEYILNGGSPVHFYVEPKPQPEGPTYPWGTKTPSVLRLRDRPGDFNIEIPTDHSELREGKNEITIQVEDMEGRSEVLAAEFEWNSTPVPLPLYLKDLGAYGGIQEIGQVVNGAFDIDAENSVIRSRAPVASDILLLLGSPHKSQEAIYDVKFTHQGKAWCFLGLSDFFAGHVPQSPELGIKPGYCTAGLATIDNTGWPQIWIAWGDCLYDKADTWVIKTEKKLKLPIQSGVTYSVRHQAIIENGNNCARFRIWRKGNPEPSIWVARRDNKNLESTLPKITTGSFGLFQYWGLTTEWSNITVKGLESEEIDDGQRTLVLT